MRLLGGAVAQLGARLDGIEEVVGSNPIGSTNAPQSRWSIPSNVIIIFLSTTTWQPTPDSVQWLAYG